MAAEGSHRYLGIGADQLNPASGGDQFEFDEADIWNVGEIILPEGGKTVLSSSRTLRIPARRRVDVDRLPVGSKSLPVNIPNWSKILHRESITRARDRGDDHEGEAEGGNYHRIPPHEYLARTRVASMSVHEGVGRTLKGRDLSNLRNAVLKKTGIERLRRQFDLANRDAMDESAEWRRRYDAEVEKAGRCSKKLNELQSSVGESGEASRTLKKKMEFLQKENMDLLERVELMKQELEAEKLRCSVQ